MRKVLLLVSLFLITIVPAFAQITSDQEVEMVSFISNPLGIQGLRPDAWLGQANAEGVFLRASDPLDSTAIIMQAQPIAKETFLAELPDLLMLTAELEQTESIETQFFTWDVYQSTRTQGNQELIIELAVTEDIDTGRTYYILMQTNDFSLNDLREQVFTPAVEWLSPIQTYEDQAETFTVPVPVQWQALAIDDVYGQITNLDNSVAIFVTAIESDDPIQASEDFLQRINTDFNPDVFVEEPTVEVINDPERIGDIESVTIVNWVAPTEDNDTVLQTVARNYDGTIYITAVISTVDAIIENERDIATIDNGFMINALETEMTEE